MPLIVALDTETTGLDLFHSCRPYLVTICRSDDPDAPLYWPWKVDPLTRMPRVERGDIAQVVSILDEADEIVFQNAKYDIRALVSVGLKWKEAWWGKVQDLLFSSHILASGKPRDLTAQAMYYLGVDIKPLELKLQEVTNACRDFVRNNDKYSDWQIVKKVAEGGEPPPGLPSLKGEESLWKWDMWLGEAIADAEGLPDDHEYRTALPEYALGDSSVTLQLRLEHKRLLEERDLLPLYEVRRKLIKIIFDMEGRGVTYSASRLEEIMGRFSEESRSAEAVCLSLASRKGFTVKFPKAGSNGSLQALAEAEEGLDFPGLLKGIDPSFEKGGNNARTVNKSGYRTKTGKLSLAKAVRDTCLQLLETREPRGWRQLFIKNWSVKSSRDTAYSYCKSYKRFGIPLRCGSVLLHPSLNATGSGTLRFSSSNPNEQNISKRSETNIRYAFGPAPGREWWSLDYENLELRIPAYEANEEEMIQLFERPHDPPYYGSQHLLVSHILWPKEFDYCLEHGEDFKGKYKDTLYQWTKNGDFAVTYGAVEESGTADRAYHQVGAQGKIKSRFKKLSDLNDYWVDVASQQGFVLTMADKEIGLGYPLQIPLGEWGRIVPTTPLNYHVQGTAMWCTCKAMIRCSEYLAEVSRERRQPYYMTMQVHDEIDFDFPKGPTPDYNLPIALECKRLMELSGDDIGVPLRVDVSYHPENWQKSLDVEEVLAA